VKSASLTRLSPRVTLVIVVLACLVPFANKAFFLDDPLFLWTAEQIRHAPANFYGFNVNWFGLVMPMTDATANPPGMCYFLAFASLLTGWKEIPLHLFCMIPALAAALGTFQLATKFCSKPLFAAVIAVVTPGFLLCASTLMCDMLTLALWIWSLALWIEGFDNRKYSWFIIAGVLAGFCILTKYSGLCLLPLLLAYALVRERAIRSWVFALLIPLAMFGAYEWLAWRLYGVVLFRNAAAYSSEVSPFSLDELPRNLVGGLVFTGGCALAVLAFAPFLWRPRALLAGFGLFLLLIPGHAVLNALALLFSGHWSLGALLQDITHSLAATWPLELQRAVWLVTGGMVVTLAISDFGRRRDFSSILLGLWVIGILLFASIFNWTINGRSILPLLPAVGILLARRIEQLGYFANPRLRTGLLVGVLVSVVAALALMLADYKLAETGRRAAQLLAQKYPLAANHLQFEGHWGFQYYLQKLGYQPLDVWKATPGTGELIAIPSGNDMYSLPLAAARLKEVLQLPTLPKLATLNRFVGAGFHTDFWGPLPFRIGQVEPERCYVFTVVRPFVFSSGVAMLPPPDLEQEKADMEKWQKVLISNPNDANAHAQLACLLSQPSEALEHWLAVLRQTPNDFQAHAEAGAIFQAAGDGAKAKTHYLAALNEVPDSLEVLNNVAWLLATHVDPSVRNGPEAVRAGLRACALTVNRNPKYLGTLAAAYAEAGRFGDATATARRAILFSNRSQQPQAAKVNEELLQLYLQGKAFHEGETPLQPAI
jgi:tetratricopeptide (TPR) repeat protein